MMEKRKGNIDKTKKRIREVVRIDKRSGKEGKTKKRREKKQRE